MKGLDRVVLSGVFVVVKTIFSFLVMFSNSKRRDVLGAGGMFMSSGNSLDFPFPIQSARLHFSSLTISMIPIDPL